MSEAPSYLGLLNAISQAEWTGYRWFTAWMEKTPSDDVRAVLRTVAAREGEHALAFAKRINELGYEVKPKDDPKGAELLAIAASDRSDMEKFEALGLCDLGDTILTFFDTVFSDHSIDIRTGELLGRYVAEEHDTARLFAACYAQLEASTTRPAPADTASSAAIAELNAKVDTLTATVEQLCQAMLPSSNGKDGRSKSKAARSS